jgi:glycosyltransferase involved in cell wall biosynthesis
VQVRRIAYVTRELPHYRVPLIDAFAHRGVACDILIAGRSGRGGNSREFGPMGSDRVRHFHQQRIGWRSDILRSLGSCRVDAIIVEHGASLDFTWTVLLATQLKGTPRVLWTHGIERRERFTNRKSLASRGRWWQLRLADGILCYDSATANQLQHSFPEKVVGFAPNSVDGDTLTSRLQELKREGRETVRRRLGLEMGHYLLTLGRLAPEKEFHRIIPILEHVRAAGVQAGAIVVGAGPEAERVERLAREHGFTLGKDLILTGEISDASQLAQWLYCADVSVQPGALGLAVVDCLFAGVPTITVRPGPKGPFHGPEWAYIVHGSNGWVVEENTDLALAIVAGTYLAETAERRMQYRESCTTYAQAHLGVGRMVDGILMVLQSTAARLGRPVLPC